MSKLKMRTLKESKVPLSRSAMERLLCMLVFHLGGEQTFTIEEMNEIEQMISAVTISVDSENRIILRSRTHEMMKSSTA